MKEPEISHLKVRQPAQQRQFSRTHVPHQAVHRLLQERKGLPGTPQPGVHLRKLPGNLGALLRGVPHRQSILQKECTFGECGTEGVSFSVTHIQNLYVSFGRRVEAINYQ